MTFVALQPEHLEQMCYCVAHDYLTCNGSVEKSARDIFNDRNYDHYHGDNKESTAPFLPYNEKLYSLEDIEGMIRVQIQKYKEWN